MGSDSSGDGDLVDRWIAHTERTDAERTEAGRTPADSPAQPVPAAPVPLARTRRAAPGARADRDATVLSRLRAAGHRALHGTPEDLAPDPAPEPTRDLPHPALAADPDAALRERLSRTTYHDPGAREERERAAAEARPDGPPPPSIAFRPRTGARRLATVLLLLGLAATALAGWQAYETRMDTDYGLTAILALFTGIVWAVRTGSRPTRLTLHGGRLTVDTPGERQVFDLHDHAVHVEMVGEPGRRGWKVLLRRGSRAPYVLTSALVDPWDLTEALRYHRPDL